MTCLFLSRPSCQYLSVPNALVDVRKNERTLANTEDPDALMCLLEVILQPGQDIAQGSTFGNCIVSIFERVVKRFGNGSGQPWMLLMKTALNDYNVL